MKHAWMLSRLNHGTYQCRNCLITDREADAIGSTECGQSKFTATEIKRPQLTVIQGGKRA